MNPRKLADKNSDVVQAALTQKCAACKAAPGRVCVDIISGQTLYEARGRWVHMFRVEP